MINSGLSNFHLHLTGSLSADDLRYVSRKIGYDISTYEPIEKHIDFESPNIWAASKELTSTEQGLLESVKLIVKKQRLQGVNYCELTMNPYGMVRRGLSPMAISQAVKYAAVYASRQGLSLRVKFGVNRKDDPSTVAIVKDVYDKTDSSIKIGIDLNGDERRYPTASFVREFRALKEQGIPTIIHAGEFMDQIESLEQALSANPSRLAHALASVKRDDLLEEITRKRIPIESAPTSSSAREAVKDLRRHPIKNMFLRGAILLIGTDDPVFFNSTVEDEYSLLKDMGLSQENVTRIYERAQKLRKFD